MPALGEVLLNHDINYNKVEDDVVATFLVPYVLKRGKIITGHRNHKNMGYPSITIAAKVSINGKEGYIAVAIKGTKDARYNAHKIISAEGRFGYEKNAEPTRFERDQLKTEQRSDIGSAFFSYYSRFNSRKSRLF